MSARHIRDGYYAVDPVGRDGMIGADTDVRVYLACGTTDMRKWLGGLSAPAQDVLRQRPANGAVIAVTGRKGDRIKLLYWDSQGLCLYYKFFGERALSVAFGAG